jgi:hypothetical protein
MYLQITTRCNMSCAHCCFSATQHGEDMSKDVLRAALKLAESRDEYLTIGGGEPTVHPEFWEYLGLVLAYSNPDAPVLVVTNGKRKDHALRLAGLARRGVLACELSQDDFHDPVHAEVVAAFTPRTRSNYEDRGRDMRGMRSVHRILPVGRALEENVATENDGCACEDLLVAPDGTLYACGCKTIKLGTVWRPELPDNWHPEWAHQEGALRLAA